MTSSATRSPASTTSDSSRDEIVEIVQQFVRSFAAVSPVYPRASIAVV